MDVLCCTVDYVKEPEVELRVVMKVTYLHVLLLLVVGWLCDDVDTRVVITAKWKK